MRNLSKVVFINSANKSVRYAEVNLDGNVHFIGTQGVGKSTLLRAILFFYNADKTKLGIPREKKGFDEYYFPFRNSYIIYEVARETGNFCIIAFISHGRVAFRFFDSAYDKSFFIDSDGKAFETWEKTREVFGRHINYSKIINNYEEYRNIVYGNNQGLSSEFRKYAILESKQFQNIPRTIQNVFLNSKLEAEFIKETIIKSLNEEEIKIDLTTYSHSHLKDFEREMSDIKKWTDKTKNGESPLKKQAEEVSKSYISIGYLEKQKKEFAKQLGWAWDNLQLEQPRHLKEKDVAEEGKRKIEQKLKRSEELFKVNENKINGELSVLRNKLKEIKDKQDDYDRMNILELLDRVSKKNDLQTEKNGLENERVILTSNFSEIKQRYEALIKEYENNKVSFDNDKTRQKNNLQSTLNAFKDKIGKEYEGIFEGIRTQQKESLDIARALVDEKKGNINELKIKRAKAENKHYYQTEIEDCKKDIATLKAELTKAENEIRQSGEKRKNIEREGELEELKIKAEIDRKIERQNEASDKCRKQIEAINTKIESSKDSLYGWLNDEVPDWQNNIGKVIDEDYVLFSKDLNPRKINDSNSFYGVELDLNVIGKTVKTIADYHAEKEAINARIAEIINVIGGLNQEQVEKIEKLRKKYQPVIKDLKDAVKENEYLISQNKQKLDENDVLLTAIINKAGNEKKSILLAIDTSIAKENEALIDAEKNKTIAEGDLNKLIDGKKKEKEGKIKAEEKIVLDIISTIDFEIKEQVALVNKQINETKEKQKAELNDKGADTKRIAELEANINIIVAELDFIENKRDIVAEFNKDKRELFDKTDEFKAKKASSEKQLETKLADYNLQKSSLLNELKGINEAIAQLTNILKSYEEDIEAFDKFKGLATFKAIEGFFKAFEITNKTNKQTKQIIDELNEIHYKETHRYTELQEAINKFTGNFSEENMFSFKTKFNSRDEYLSFAEKLKEFIEEDKISDYIKRVQERFANIIRQIGKETGDLITKEGEIHGIISDINKDFESRNFVGAIKSIELRTVTSANKIFQLLVEIKKFNDENSFNLGAPSLFSSDDHTSKNEKAIDLLKKLIKEMSDAKENEIKLSDSFELQFRIKENDNDTDWVEKLANVGSDGTDILVKAMINIMLLNVFKDRATKKQKGDFVLHCMMDEIGKLHPSNVKGILKFANDRNIYLINSSPTSYNPIDYKYTYLLSKDDKNATIVKRLVKKI